jgi:uncharacterized protein involved in exopolysaccharide biosynthesis
VRSRRDIHSYFLAASREEIQMNDVETITTSSTPRPMAEANWVTNSTLLWEHRHLLARVIGIALIVSVLIAFLIPKQYESVARLMPPDQPNSGVAMLAAIAGHSMGSLGGLGSLAGNLLGGRSSDALFVDLLRSRTISDHLIDRFDLQKIYRKRYRIDTMKYLARHTAIVEDKKSGVITLTFTDTDPRRARAVAQAYLDELNSIVTRSNTSSARREREFIEKRLVNVQAELQDAEKALSNFSSTHTMLDVREQTHAMVDAAAKLQAELIVGQSELDSLNQIYGPENVRVRAAQARIASLRRELTRLSGSSALTPAETSTDSGQDGGNLYPSLRQMPRLAVPYADLYRRVRIQETVFELLSQQYEIARVQEAKDTPVVSVIDPPLVAEKKSFPPRLLTILLLTTLATGITSAFILARYFWQQVSMTDQRRLLAEQIFDSLSMRVKRLARKNSDGVR